LWAGTRPRFRQLLNRGRGPRTVGGDHWQAPVPANRPNFKFPIGGTPACGPPDEGQHAQCAFKLRTPGMSVMVTASAQPAQCGFPRCSGRAAVKPILRDRRSSWRTGREPVGRSGYSRSLATCANPGRQRRCCPLPVASWGQLLDSASRCSSASSTVASGLGFRSYISGPKASRRLSFPGLGTERSYSASATHSRRHLGTPF
jgi:hypothetical protein